MFRPTRRPAGPHPARPVARTATVLLALVTALAGPASADDVGDLVQFQPRTPARADEVNQNFADVKAAVNTKSTDGVEFASSDGSVAISDQSSTPTVVATATVTAPGPGFVKADFSAYLSIGHTQNAGTSYTVCALKTNATSPESSTGRIQGSRRFVPVLSAEVSGTHYPHVDTMGVLSVDAAGSYTVNVVCYRNSGSNSATMFYRTLAVTYHSDRL
jgi:hypothetical protein